MSPTFPDQQSPNSLTSASRLLFLLSFFFSFSSGIVTLIWVARHCDGRTTTISTMASNPNPSNNSNTNSNVHAPSTPSGLRQSYTLSPDSSPEALRSSPPQSRPTGPTRVASETTGLLTDVLYRDHAHEGPCDHGTFSPRPISPEASLGPSYYHSQNGSRAPSPGASSESSLPIIDSVVAFVAAKGAPDWRNRWAKRMKSKTMSRSSELAERHGVKDSPFMCVTMA